ncbi:MAG: metal ABC transporter substrate-binding protein [Candidatus Bathyarchaeia archaeon]
MVKNLERNLLAIIIILLLSTPVILTGQATVKTSNVNVAVTIEPLASIVEAVGGEAVSVQILLPEGVEPHTFQATPEIVTKAMEADLIFHTGHFPFEEHLVKTAGRPSIGLREYLECGLNLSRMPTPHSEEDHHGGYNLHGYWLKPENAKAMGEAAAAALAKIDPEHAQQYYKNLEGFEIKLRMVKSHIDQLKVERGLEGLRVAVTFPSEAYLAETFGMEVASMLTRGENIFIGGGELADLEERLRRREINLIISSELAKQMKVGEFAEQLAQDTDTPIIYFRVIAFRGLRDYPALIMYNVGVVSNIGSNPKSGGESAQWLCQASIVALTLLALAEATLIVRGWRRRP